MFKLKLCHSCMVGISFGLTSGIITTLGTMVGLYASTHSILAVIGGIIAIAVADAFSDAMGIHVSEEAEGVHTHKEVWGATLATFLTKFTVALTFVIPLLLLPLMSAIYAAIIWGFALLAIFSVLIARMQNASTKTAVIEHVALAVLVVAVTYWVGNYISVIFV